MPELAKPDFRPTQLIDLIVFDLGLSNPDQSPKFGITVNQSDGFVIGINLKLCVISTDAQLIQNNITVNRPSDRNGPILTQIDEKDKTRLAFKL